MKDLLWRTLGRWLLWALLALLLVRGAADLLLPHRPAAAPAAAATAPEWSDRQAFEAQALLFVRDYFSWGAGGPDERSARLRTWAAPDVVDRLAADLGDGVQGQQVQGAWVQGARRIDPLRAVVTVAVQVVADPAGESHPGNTPAGTPAAVLANPPARWFWLAVPVARQGDRYGIYDLPTPLPAPGPPGRQPATYTRPEVPDVGGEIRDLVDSFLRAYAQGTPAQLRYFLAPGAAMAGLGGALAYTELSDLRVVSSGSGTVALAVAVLQDPVTHARLHQRFVLDIVRQQERWLVNNMLESGD